MNISRDMMIGLWLGLLLGFGLNNVIVALFTRLFWGKQKRTESKEEMRERIRKDILENGIKFYEPAKSSDG